MTTKITITVEGTDWDDAKARLTRFAKAIANSDRSPGGYRDDGSPHTMYSAEDPTGILGTFVVSESGGES